MKLSKVTKVLNLFSLNTEQLTDYKVDDLDVNRVPNTGATPDRNPVATQVNLLRNVDGRPQVLPLPTGVNTAKHITDDTVAVHVEFRYDNGQYQKLLLIK